MRNNKLTKLVTELRESNNTAFIGGIADSMFDKSYMKDEDIELELSRTARQLQTVKDKTKSNECGALTKSEKKLLAKLIEYGF